MKKVKVVGFLVLVGGLIIIYAALSILKLGHGVMVLSRFSGDWSPGMSLGLFIAVTAIGLIYLKRWALPLFVLLMLLAIIEGIIGLMSYSGDVGYIDNPVSIFAILLYISMLVIVFANRRSFQGGFSLSN